MSFTHRLDKSNIQGLPTTDNYYIRTSTNIGSIEVKDSVTYIQDFNYQIQGGFNNKRSTFQVETAVSSRTVAYGHSLTQAITSKNGVALDSSVNSIEITADNLLCVMAKDVTTDQTTGTCLVVLKGTPQNNSSEYNVYGVDTPIATLMAAL